MITYECEKWVIRESMKRKILITERKVIRRTVGPTKESDRESTWKIKINDERNSLIRN